MKKPLIRLVAIIVLALLAFTVRYFFPKSGLSETEVPVQEQIEENENSDLSLSEEETQVTTGEELTETGEVEKTWTVNDLSDWGKEQKIQYENYLDRAVAINPEKLEFMYDTNSPIVIILDNDLNRTLQVDESYIPGVCYGIPYDDYDQWSKMCNKALEEDKDNIHKAYITFNNTSLKVYQVCYQGELTGAEIFGFEEEASCAKVGIAENKLKYSSEDATRYLNGEAGGPFVIDTNNQYILLALSVPTGGSEPIGYGVMKNIIYTMKLK